MKIFHSHFHPREKILWKISPLTQTLTEKDEKSDFLINKSRITLNKGKIQSIKFSITANKVQVHKHNHLVVKFLNTKELRDRV